MTFGNHIRVTSPMGSKGTTSCGADRSVPLPVGEDPEIPAERHQPVAVFTLDTRSEVRTGRQEMVDRRLDRIDHEAR